MSYVKGLDYKKRRPHITRLSPAEAIAKANSIAEAADKRIAYWKGQADHFAAIAAELEAGNRAIAAERDELAARGRALEADIERLRRRLKPKAKTRRGDFEG